MATLGGVPDNKYFEDKAYSNSSPMPARIILYSKASVLPPDLPSVRRSTFTQSGTWPRSAQVSPMSFGDDRGSDTWDNSRLPYTTPSCCDNELWAAPHINYKDRSITASTKLPDLNNRLVSPADVNVFLNPLGLTTTPTSHVSKVLGHLLETRTTVKAHVESSRNKSSIEDSQIQKKSRHDRASGSRIRPRVYPYILPSSSIFADDGLAEAIGDSLVSMLDVYDDGICGGGIHSRTRPGAGHVTDVFSCCPRYVTMNLLTMVEMPRETAQADQTLDAF
ncbi:unnamed protein product [Aspergillus oryzae]|nr:unnamed protein product [Aspergillus oryzae]GMF89405.1 unnamed protein product [Aspergillus oryzae]